MTLSLEHYSKRLQPALQLIEQSLSTTEPASVRDLADACFISPFHFHRVYRLLTGETCQQTITRLRLALAANAMTDLSLNITDIAQSVGYSSSQALAKALKQKTGSTASELRGDDEKLAKTIEILSAPDNQHENSPPLSIELTALSPMTIVSIKTKDSYPKLNEVYHALFEAVGDPMLVQGILGQPGPDCAFLAEEGNEFNCALLLREDAKLEDSPTLESLSVQSGDYARVRHNGSFDNLEETLDGLYISVMQHGNLAFADEPCLFHYLDDPEETAENELRTDLYVPIERG